MITIIITRDELAAMSTTSSSMRPDERAALERLIAIAKSDTGQSRKVANFLLAWWNAANNGGFDLTDLWAVDNAIAADMTSVFAMVARIARYPESLGFRADFEAIWRAWRND